MIGGFTPGRLKGAIRSNNDSTSGSDELSNPWIAAAAVLLVLLLPLVPFLLIVWSISRTLQGVRKRVSWE